MNVRPGSVPFTLPAAPAVLVTAGAVAFAVAGGTRLMGLTVDRDGTCKTVTGVRTSGGSNVD